MTEQPKMPPQPNPPVPYPAGIPLARTGTTPTSHSPTLPPPSWHQDAMFSQTHRRNSQDKSWWTSTFDLPTLTDLISNFPNPGLPHPSFPRINNDCGTEVIQGYMRRVPCVPGANPWSPAEVPSLERGPLRARCQSRHWRQRLRYPLRAIEDAFSEVPGHWCERCPRQISAHHAIKIGSWVQLEGRLGSGCIDKVWRYEKGSLVFRVRGEDIRTLYKTAFVVVDRSQVLLGILDRIKYAVVNWWLKSPFGPTNGERTPEWV